MVVGFAVAAARADAPPPDLRRLFPLERDVQAPSGGLVRLALPPDVLAATRPDLSDLRVFDAAGQEIPYLIDTGAPRGTERELVTRASTPPSSRRGASRSSAAGAAPLYRETYVLAAPPGDATGLGAGLRAGPGAVPAPPVGRGDRRGRQPPAAPAGRGAVSPRQSAGDQAARRAAAVRGAGAPGRDARRRRRKLSRTAHVVRDDARARGRRHGGSGARRGRTRDARRAHGRRAGAPGGPGARCVAHRVRHHRLHARRRGVGRAARPDRRAAGRRDRRPPERRDRRRHARGAAARRARRPPAGGDRRRRQPVAGRPAGRGRGAPTDPGVRARRLRWRGARDPALRRRSRPRAALRPRRAATATGCAARRDAGGDRRGARRCGDRARRAERAARQSRLRRRAGAGLRHAARRDPRSARLDASAADRRGGFAAMD